MDPDDAADLLGTMNPTLAEGCWRQMDPEESDPVRRLLKHSPDTAGGLMTSRPVVVDPGHIGRRSAGPRPRSRPDSGVGVIGVVVRPPTATSDGSSTWVVCRCSGYAGAAVHAGRRDRRR